MRHAKKMLYLLIAGLATLSLALGATRGLAQDSDSAAETGGGVHHHVATESSTQQSEGSVPVEVSEDGTRFDPPVTVGQIPAGAWYCNMNGSVHYASLQQGDGSCPVCGMFLVQKPDADSPSDTHSDAQSYGHHH